MKQTQRQQVIDRLKNNGEVSRNWALSNYITRLAAIVAVLEAEGFEFTTYRDDNDYCYKLAKVATRRQVQVVEKDGLYFKQEVAVPLF